MANGTRPDEEKPIKIEDVTEPDKLSERFNEIASESQEVLISMKAVWPFDFFPNEIKLDRQTITIKRNYFFKVSKTLVSHHRDILNSNLNIGPFFGSLLINTKYLTHDEFTINWLWRDDALLLHEVLQGLLIAQKEEVDTKGLPKDDLIYKLREMGKQI